MPWFRHSIADPGTTSQQTVHMGGKHIYTINSCSKRREIQKALLVFERAIAYTNVMMGSFGHCNLLTKDARGGSMMQQSCSQMALHWDQHPNDTEQQTRTQQKALTPKW